MKKITLLLLASILLSVTSFATVRTTTTSGDWNNPSIWGGTVPVANDDVVISTGHIVTININPNNIINVTVNGTLQWDATGAARTWTVSGNFVINGTGSFICASPGTATVHTFNYNGIAFTNNGIMNLVNSSNKCNMVIGNSVTQTIGGSHTLNLNKLTLNNTGGKFVIDYGAGSFTPSETAPTKLNVSVTTADTMVIKQGLLIGCATNNATITHSFANFKLGSGTAKITSSVNVFTSVTTLTVNAAMILNDASNSNVTMSVNGSFISPSMTQANAATAFGVLGPNCFGGAGNATDLTISGDWNMTDIFVFVGNTKVFGGTEPNNPVINVSGNMTWASSETHTIDIPFTSEDFLVRTCFFGLFDSQGAFPQMNLNGGSAGTPNTLSVAFKVFDADVQSSSPLGSLTLAQISESMANWTVNGNWKITNGSSLAMHSDNTLTVNGTLRIENGGEVAGSETETEDIGYVPTNGPTISMGGNGVLYVENSGGLGKGLLSEAAAAVAFKNRTADIDWNLNGISSAGTVDYSAAGVQSITDRTYNQLSTSNSGVKTMNNAITSNSTLKIGAGTTLADGGFDATTKGTVINDGMHSGNGKIILGGTTNQSLSGTGSEWGNLQLNNAAGATCNSPVNTTGIFTLMSGILTTSSGAKLIFGATGGFLGGNAFSCVYGPVSKTTTSTAEFLFQLGKGLNYRPLSVTPGSTSSTTWTAEYFSSSYSNTTSVLAPITSVNTFSYWTLDRNGSANANVKLQWNTTEALADLN
ncbi:MAG: G8 domain-containing protein, partial [Chitinophagales bacterium]